jgi:PAS domain S-box-containing protein
MVVISQFNTIIQVNRAFCTFTGYDEDELLNRSIIELTLPEDRDRIRSMYEELFSMTTSAIDCERRYLRKDGTPVWGHVSVACIVGSDNLPTCCIAMVQDISLRKSLEEKLLLANRELDAFVHTVSHDLRSPLTPIIGYLELILDQHTAELPPQVAEMLQEVHKQSERMSDMLEDLLVLATVGSVEPPLSPVRGDEVLQDVLLRYSSPDVSIKAAALPDALMSKTLYLQILDNLVGNAIRYAGGNTVEVSGERQGGTIRLSVRDYGPGVPQHEKERIFELFYRGATGRHIAGTGIGLATVQKIARLHNGRAWVEDATGGGSIFRVEFADGFTC